MTKEMIRDKILDVIAYKVGMEGITPSDIKALSEAYAAVTQKDDLESISKLLCHTNPTVQNTRLGFVGVDDISGGHCN